MPSQKHFQFDAQDPTQIDVMFHLAQALVQDSWGVTLVANQDKAAMSTNAPSNIINFHAMQHAV